MCWNTKPRALFTALLLSGGRIRLPNNLHLMRICSEKSLLATVRLRQEASVSQRLTKGAFSHAWWFLNDLNEPIVGTFFCVIRGRV